MKRGLGASSESERTLQLDIVVGINELSLYFVAFQAGGRKMMTNYYNCFGGCLTGGGTLTRSSTSETFKCTHKVKVNSFNHIEGE